MQRPAVTANSFVIQTEVCVMAPTETLPEHHGEVRSSRPTTTPNASGLLCYGWQVRNNRERRDSAGAPPAALD